MKRHLPRRVREKGRRFVRALKTRHIKNALNGSHRTRGVQARGTVPADPDGKLALADPGSSWAKIKEGTAKSNTNENAIRATMIKNPQINLLDTSSVAGLSIFASPREELPEAEKVAKAGGIPDWTVLRATQRSVVNFKMACDESF